MRARSGILLIAVVATLLAAPVAVTFRDMAPKAGLKDVIVSGGPKKDYVLEVNGSGACWLDYDNDGWLDLYLVNGTTLSHLQSKASRGTINHLYRNNKNGTFTDVTATTGVAGSGWGFGCVAADYDNDGHTDLLVTNFGPNILYRNTGKNTFEDATVKAGVAGGKWWHAGAAFGDIDLDGDLDLFIPGYLDFNITNPELKACKYRGIKVNACGPLGYKGAPDALYVNNGNGTFTDATAKAGVADRNLYFGFQAIFEDLDNDGRPDLFVANDSNPNYFYRNKGDGTFEESGVAAGLAFSGDGKEMSSMGVAVGDYDRDGRMDIFVTTFADDNYVLFHNDGDGFFTDVSYPSGVGEPTVPYLGWGTFFFDYDNDGHLDLFCANGHVYPEVDGVLREKYKQPMQLLRNIGKGKFKDASVEAGLSALAPRSARGAAFADIDNDGDLDAVVSIMDSAPVLLENAGAPSANWLELKLTGTKSNRMAVGARVKVVSDSHVQYGTVQAGGSYLSSNDPRLHFGLRDATQVNIEIQWPAGTSQTLSNVKPNQLLAITEATNR